MECLIRVIINNANIKSARELGMIDIRDALISRLSADTD